MLNKSLLTYKEGADITCRSVYPNSSAPPGVVVARTFSLGSKTSRLELPIKQA